MRRIIYRSLASPGVDRVETFRLVYQSRVANEARGIGGFLIHIDDRFLQVLEGETWKLCATFAAIRSDHRHHAVEVIDERSIDHPAFAVWRMRYFDARNIPRMLAQIAEAAGHNIPRPVQDALSDFLGHDLVHPAGELARLAVSPGSRPAALPSFPRPC